MRYVIRGGEAGEQRLAVLARVLAPGTARFLDRAGLGPGMACLDIGCAGGSVTLDLARRVGDRGRVTGIDLDESSLEIARRATADAGLANVVYARANVESDVDWQAIGEHDFAWCRFVLTHLADPLAALRRVFRAVRPGGVVAIEDIDFAGHFCHPPNRGFDEYLRLYREVVARRGGDADIGPKLPSLLREAGFATPEVEVLQPAATSGEGKTIALLTLVAIAESLLRERLCSDSDLEAAITDLERVTADETTLLSLPRIFQVHARRPPEAGELS